MLNRLHEIFLFFMLLSCMAVHADSVGASLQLEGAMSVFRATQYLVHEQFPDGSWHHDPAATSLAACALLNAKATEPPAVVPLALAFLKQHLRPSDDWRRTIDIRALIRAKQGDFQPPSVMDCPPAARIWLLDSYAIAGRMQSLPKFQDSFYQGLAPYQKLAAKLATATDGVESFSALRQEVRLADWQTAPIEQLYWSARAFFAYDTAAASVQDNWQHDILSALLARQKGDGAWHQPDDSPEATIRQTALAIETIILCLQ